MTKRIDKSGKLKTPFQIWWDKDTREAFEALVQDYDPMLPRAVAVLKIIKWMIKDHWLPGYIRKERVVRNKLDKDIENIETRMTS